MTLKLAGSSVSFSRRQNALAPIALFVYNRPLHTQKTVEALLRNKEASESHLVIYSDAPKSSEGNKLVEEVRAYLRTIRGFESIRIVERETNFGLAKSIIDGVTSLCNDAGKVIVLEDDLITSPDFLRFMNQGLALYQHDLKVASIHGYAYPTEPFDLIPESYFLRGADCWGWATWKRAWTHFEPDGNYLLRQLEMKQLSYRFDYDGRSSYVRMLRHQTMGKNDSWAIRWHASAFINDMLTLYPRDSLVINIGFDESGTHGGADYFVTNLGNGPNNLAKIEITENEFMREQVGRFFHKVKWMRLKSIWKRIIPWIMRFMKKSVTKKLFN